MFYQPHNRRDITSGPNSTNLAFQHDTSHEYKLQGPGVPGPVVHARAHLPLQGAKPIATVEEVTLQEKAEDIFRVLPSFAMFHNLLPYQVQFI